MAAAPPHRGRTPTEDHETPRRYLQLVEKVGVWCDNVGHITVHVLLPAHCCCHLDTYRTTASGRARVLTALAQHLRGWMTAMADDDMAGAQLWQPPTYEAAVKEAEAGGFR